MDLAHQAGRLNKSVEELTNLLAIDEIVDEELYRSVPEVKSHFQVIKKGEWRLSSSSFQDPNKQPSLYRKLLCTNPPDSNPPRRGEKHAVFLMLAGQIKQGAVFIHRTGNPPKQKQIKYEAVVTADRSNGQDIAHAIVKSTPAIEQNKAFDSLKEILIILAMRHEPAIKPSEEFLCTLPGYSD